MKGAICGDVIGSIYEGLYRAPDGFPLFSRTSRFTDDTVMTVACADAIMSAEDFGEAWRRWGLRHPDAGYGNMFGGWLRGDVSAYKSFGNGAPMRVSPCAWLAHSKAAALDLAERSCQPTHGSENAIRSSRAVVAAIFTLRKGGSAADGKKALVSELGIDLEPLEDILTRTTFDIDAFSTVRTAASCAFQTRNFEDAVRAAVLAGGDADTTAAIAGSIAEAMHGIPAGIWYETAARLSPDLLSVVKRFDAAQAQAKKPSFLMRLRGS